MTTKKSEEVDRKSEKSGAKIAFEAKSLEKSGEVAQLLHQRILDITKGIPLACSKP